METKLALDTAGGYFTEPRGLIVAEVGLNMNVLSSQFPKVRIFQLHVLCCFGGYILHFYITLPLGNVTYFAANAK